MQTAQNRGAWRIGRLPAALLALGFVAGVQADDSIRIKEAKWESGDQRLVVKVERAGRRAEVVISNATLGGLLGTYSANSEGKLEAKISKPSPVPCRVKAQANGKTAERSVERAPRDCDQGANPPPPPPPPNPGNGVSINSTSQNSADAGVNPAALGPVLEQLLSGDGQHQLVAINDLGMHCGDLDTRIASILPPFQVALAQVIRKGPEPQLLDATAVDVFYSAASNPVDPILNDPTRVTGIAPDGSVYKTNFWSVIPAGAYDPFYPPVVTPLAGAVTPDVGLPVPDVEELYLEGGTLVATQQKMPGVLAPYSDNQPQKFQEYVHDKPFFTGFAFGYVAEDLNWHEAAGIPLAAFDDRGRENAYPLFRIQAKTKAGQTLASRDTVLPISGEADCKGCHSAEIGSGVANGRLNNNVVTSISDPAGDKVPMNASIEWAADINILRLHDVKWGTHLESTVDPVTGIAAEPVVCQRCHYTPALDLAQVGPKGPGDPDANGREQTTHATMSSVMHLAHGTYTDAGGNRLFPDMPPAIDAAGNLRSPQVTRDTLEQTCYQCHPGKQTNCLRGAMANGGMVCQDCHGNMEQVGSDFSKDVPNGGNFVVKKDFYTNPSTPRVPWANEPGCGSCHTGDAVSNLAGAGGTLVNPHDTLGNPDGIRLKQAFLSGDPKATPILPLNLRFAENRVAAAFNGTPNPGAGNPKLYRVSTGHGGVFCEGCHGATHAEWPNANPNANDNVTANQIQGHSGTIIECNACHTGDLGNTLDGPHGMHPVGDVRFVNGGHEDMTEHNPAGLQQCAACHGAQGQGTVLSVAKADRTGLEEIGTIRKGTPVSCGMCHGNPYTGGGGD